MTSSTEGRTVLIGFADALAAPEVAWSLADAGFGVVAFSRRGARASLHRWKGVEVVGVPPPELDAAATARAVAALARERAVVGVLPLDDAAVWVAAGAADAGVPVVGPTGARADLALDKELQLAAARRAGMQVPATTVIASTVDASGVIEFPVIVKSARAIDVVDGALRRVAPVVCADEHELGRAVADRLRVSPRLLAQPLLNGVGEGIFGLVAGGSVHAPSAHRRIRMMNPAGSGSSACVSIAVDDALVDAARLMLDAVDWSGLFMLEFLRDDRGTAWFMELNGRPWGSMALARRTGLEYPAWAVRAAVDPTFRPPDSSPPAGVVCRHLGRELVHVLMVLRGRRSPAGSWPSRARTLHEVLRFRRGDRWYNWRPGAAALFADDTIRTVVSQVRGRR